jgi:branched-chain amino acid transport system permease protein
MIFMSIYGIVAASLNIVSGYCGLLTMAHASYFAIGCYTYALAAKSGMDFIPACLLGMVISGMVSLALSVPSWRMRGDSFVLISLAVQQMLFSLFQNWTNPNSEPGTWTNLTNGTFGLTNIPKPTICGLTITDVQGTAILSACSLVACLLFSKLLLSSPWARMLQATRDDELATRGMGKNVRLAKMQAIAISCGMAAFGGALYAAYVNYVDPTIASLDESMLILCMVLVGGTGNFRGPFIGAVVLLAIPELLRFAGLPDAVASNIRLLIYGLMLILMMHFRPRGLAGSYRVS